MESPDHPGHLDHEVMQEKMGYQGHKDLLDLRGHLVNVELLDRQDLQAFKGCQEHLETLAHLVKTENLVFKDPQVFLELLAIGESEDSQGKGDL